MKLEEMQKLSVSDVVKNTRCEFMYYRDGELWYKVEKYFPSTEKHVGSDYFLDDSGYRKVFEFPVPVKDTGSGIFKTDMKSIQMMRWIRKHLETIKEWTK